MAESESASVPLISVIIPHRNQNEYLEQCLTSLDRQSLPRAIFEIIVVDNGSAVPPEDVVARHPGVKLLQEPEPGPGPARSRGVLAAAGHILAFIDADCRADVDWLRVLSHELEAAGESTVIGGDVRIWRDDPSRFTALEAYESVFAYRFKLYIEKQGYSGTGNMAVRRTDYQKVGHFAGIAVAEDVDWGRRARDAGLRFRYVPGMMVFHPARISMAELYSKWKRHIQHNLNEARGSPWWRVRWLGRAFAIFMSSLPDAGTVMVSDRVRGLSARAKAIGVLIAIRAYRAWTMARVLGSSDEVVWNGNRASGGAPPNS
jgi:GT2 family glycosyltransferase